MLWDIIVLSLAQQHLVMLLQKGSILAPLRSHRLLSKLLSCPICIGFWAAVAVVAAPWPVSWVLATAGLGYALGAARDKFLPCSACESAGQQHSIKNYKVV